MGTRAVKIYIMDHLNSGCASHLIGGVLPSVSCERRPEDSLDYKVMGHVQKRCELLRKRRGGAVWTVLFVPLEKSLYIQMPGEEDRWLFTRLMGSEEWSPETLAFLNFSVEELMRGAPDF